MTVLGAPAVLSSAELSPVDAQWRAANHLAACRIYLMVETPLEPEHVKPWLLARKPGVFGISADPARCHGDGDRRGRRTGAGR
ncbi:hypothetical protein [Amycolatopsis sp. EV170708-02-1]|uniref:hypothetical protein n=1 Tax=Amycolatopsis sp. EV170708-02-1 TaxID=2919322 RepID=UPI001F0CD844|nr:hypothetical protein [Amycolatopsis sp. EV170708-02-1]UMP07747.1 hypothetical protein MJQ72_21640 [Amycolatopsis sp. EV170708-02-1]